MTSFGEEEKVRKVVEEQIDSLIDILTLPNENE